VRVTVLSTDLARNRIALTMKTKVDGVKTKVDGAPVVAPAPRSPRAATPFVPRAGSVAPNGMRFK
jgi:hypothetical protein